jgi:hypothetical protein
MLTSQPQSEASELVTKTRLNTFRVQTYDLKSSEILNLSLERKSLGKSGQLKENFGGDQKQDVIIRIPQSNQEMTSMSAKIPNVTALQGLAFEKQQAE